METVHPQPSDIFTWSTANEFHPLQPACPGHEEKTWQSPENRWALPGKLAGGSSRQEGEPADEGTHEWESLFYFTVCGDRVSETGFEGWGDTLSDLSGYFRFWGEMAGPPNQQIESLLLASKDYKDRACFHLPSSCLYNKCGLKTKLGCSAGTQSTNHAVLCWVAQACPTLVRCPKDCSPPGSSVRGLLQARTLEWVAMPSSRGSSWPRDWTRVSFIGRWILYHLRPQGSPRLFNKSSIFKLKHKGSWGPSPVKLKLLSSPASLSRYVLSSSSISAQNIQRNVHILK